MKKQTIKDIREKIRINQETLAIFDSIKANLYDRGLMILDRYFCKKIGISEQTLYNMKRNKNLANVFILKHRLKVAKKLYIKLVEKNKLF